MAVAFSVGTFLTASAAFASAAIGYANASSMADQAQATAEWNAAMQRMQAENSARLAQAVGEGQAANIKVTADYQAAVAKNNAILAKNDAIIATQSAQLARDNSVYSADRLRKRNRLLRGAQIAKAGAASVTISGSVADVVFDSALEGELNVLNELYIGGIQATSAANRARGLQYQSDFYDHSSEVILQTGINNANSALWEGETGALTSLWSGQARSNIALYTGRARSSYYTGEARGSLVSGGLRFGASFFPEE